MKKSERSLFFNAKIHLFGYKKCEVILLCAFLLIKINFKEISIEELTYYIYKSTY